MGYTLAQIRWPQLVWRSSQKELAQGIETEPLCKYPTSKCMKNNVFTVKYHVNPPFPYLSSQIPTLSISKYSIAMYIIVDPETGIKITFEGSSSAVSPTHTLSSNYSNRLSISLKIQAIYLLVYIPCHCKEIQDRITYYHDNIDRLIKLL